jgi:translation initiation factor 3 subunit A
MLRQHLSALQKAGTTKPDPNERSNRLRGWEGWTQASIESHLTTRFAQLEMATSLELWGEGFRTVEDIYAVMQISKKAPKAKLLARYYHQLTEIFWVSGHHLFHALACHKHFAYVGPSPSPSRRRRRRRPPLRPAPH